YENFISNLLLYKEKIIMGVILLFLISLGILLKHERQFLPNIDQRQFIVKVTLSPGTKLEITDHLVKKIEQLLFSLPETKDVTVNIGSSEEKASAETALQSLGSHQAQIMVNLKKKNPQKGIRLSTLEVIQYLKSNLQGEEFRDAEIEYVAQESSLSTALEESAPVIVEIRGPDLNQLANISVTIQNKLKNIPGLYGIKNSMISPSPETKLYILKDKASLFGLSVKDIAITTQVALKGYVATKFKEKYSEDEVDVRVRLQPKDRMDLNNLRRLLIQTPLGTSISLSQVAYFTKGAGPTEIKRIDQQRTVLVSANVFKRSLTAVLKDVNNVLTSLKKEISAYKDYSIQLTGEQQKMSESFQSLAFALALSIILVYMIMAGEFESFWQPFIIMFTIPLSLIGVSFALFITRTALNVVAYLGIIMLGGIAVNNGIVLIDFINQLRKEGYSPQETVILASKTRLRPILMTSLTTILGLIPMALGIGEGAELRSPLALTVIGGLTSTTFLTLIVIPALYLKITERLQIIGSFILPIKSIKLPKVAPETLSWQTAEEKIELKTEEKIEQKQFYPPEDLLTKNLNERQLEILEKLKVIKKITRKQYAEMFSISIPTAARDLKELLEKKLLKANGPLGPGRWYELNKDKDKQ
ncbi:MAG: efflux RND transporter permease subunit, partial [Candidatus Omnitrophica bacterium]|nr:efflux RND transporter permease subunit [Candidatus Omnitrophota bacterium]